VGWDTEHYGFMHLGFQEYLAAREIRSRAFSNPEVIKELASHFGESWWEEVALLLLALEDPSLFEPFMREVVKLPAFARNAHLVELCLDDAAEVSTAPFRELLVKAADKDRGLWEKQFAALGVLNRLDPKMIEALAPKLKSHPYDQISNWFKSKTKEDTQRATQGIIHTSPGNVELVRIPGGSFMMGLPDEEFEEIRNKPSSGVKKNDWERWLNFQRPSHKVEVNPFCMGRYPVTNEEYGKFLEANPKVKEPKFWADKRRNQPNQPVVGVDWVDAKGFAEWAGCRLPSEAEWEYACRAGTTGPRYDDLDRIAWYGDNSEGRSHPVRQKKPNAFGLYDTLGNVWEWCEDDWHDSYKSAPNDGRAWVGEERVAIRVVRGGGWGSNAGRVRASGRYGSGPDGRGNHIGFRLSRDCE